MSQLLDRKPIGDNQHHGKFNGHGTGNPASGNGKGVRLLDLSHVAPEIGVARLIERAVELRASDLFIATNEQHVVAQVRLRGRVETIAILDRDQGRRYVAHVRNQAGMDVSDHRKPHDGRWIFDVDPHRAVDLRINVVPTLHGEDMAVRLLDREHNILPLERLGMTGRQLDVYRPLLEQPGGMILFTGPTGSGKTVTLYASLGHLNDGHRKIHTIEDPVEYAIDGLRQSPVNPGIDLGPNELMRGVLRQAPDAVMVGEIRDEEISRTAVWAANSGTLVLSTIHAAGAAGAVQSLRAFGIAPAFIASSLRAAVSQRLVRTLCPHCQDVSEDGHTAHVRQMMEEIKTFLPAANTAARYIARGCDHCHGTGYAGSTAVYEVMPMTDAIRDLIVEGYSTREIHARAVKDGMLTLRQAGLLKVAQGRTTVEEVRRVVPDIAPEPVG